MAGYLIILVVLAIVFVLITGPLRAARHARSDVGVTFADLQAARDAKYQEIRDAEMDLRTGKLSDEDYASIDATLRAEAIEILRRLDDAEAALPVEEDDDELDDDLDALDGPVGGAPGAGHGVSSAP